MPAFTIRPMNANDMSFAIDCAAAEGWNLGLNDAHCFYHADNSGFLLGELGGKSIGCISAVSYGAFGFIGLYIIIPEQRGKGYGITLWQQAIERLNGQNIGLDGVAAQQANYARSGFVYAYGNTRYEGSRLPAAQQETPANMPPPSETGAGRISSADAVDFSDLCAYDHQFFPANRAPFLRAWLMQSGARAIVWRHLDNTLGGFAVSRPCRRGRKIGPLFADTPAIAAALLADLYAVLPADTPFYLDIPNPNTEAKALAAYYQMRPVFTTARMYKGELPPLAAGVYGVTTFELG